MVTGIGSFADGRLLLALVSAASNDRCPYSPSTDPTLNWAAAMSAAEGLFGVPWLWKPTNSPTIVAECPRAVVMYLGLLKLRLDALHLLPGTGTFQDADGVAATSGVEGDTAVQVQVQVQVQAGASSSSSASLGHEVADAGEDAAVQLIVSVHRAEVSE